MSSFRIVQLSDTHLSARHPLFQANWDAVVEALTADPPDRVIVTGDVAYDGAARAGDLDYARAQLERLPVPWRVLPGNHDVGEVTDDPAAPPAQPITVERLLRWRACMGRDWWAEELGPWRLLGLNAQLFGSGLPDEAEQTRWLEQTLAEGPAAPAAPTVLFLHKPLYHMEPETSPRSHLSLWPDHRDWLAGLCAKNGVRLVATGHLHQFRKMDWSGLHLVWAPPTCFVLKSRRAPDHPGSNEVGAVEHLLHADGRVASRYVRLGAMVDHDFEELTDNRRIPYLELGAE